MIQKVKMIYAQLARWAFPVIGIILILSVQRCRHSEEQSSAFLKNFDSVALQAVHYQNLAGQTIAENNQLKVASTSDLKAFTDTLFNLRAENRRNSDQVLDYARIIQQARFTGKLAEYKKPDTTAGKTAIVQPPDTDLLRVPYAFGYTDSTISLAGQVLKKGVLIDSIKIENTVHLRTVEQKSGFLNLSRSAVVQVLNTNPAFKTMGVASVTVPYKPNWWQRWGKFAAGAALGVVAGSKL
jgi:hypothetical protein